LSSVRELARELAVNQNTVLRVYERLSSEGLLEMRHGQGTFVAANSSEQKRAAHRARIVDELRQIAQQAAGLGLSTDELHELLSEAANDVVQRQPAAAQGGSTS
jgi:GntR family transcriptional regulator